jgi:SNF2 family DNA or RNA helicase
MSNQAAHYLQSLDRIHRRGQQRDVEYLIVMADGSIEIDEYERLLAKERTAQGLLGDHVDAPSTRDRLLHDLTAAADRACLETT